MTPHDHAVLAAATAWCAARDANLRAPSDDTQRALWNAEARLNIAAVIRQAVTAPELAR